MWFQEVPCGFRNDRVVSGEAVWFHEGVCPILCWESDGLGVDLGEV